MDYTRSKSGLLCAWSKGGGEYKGAKSGEATIVVNEGGDSKTPIFIKQNGHLSNSNHGLFPVNSGDYVIKVERNHRPNHDMRVSIFRGGEKEPEFYYSDWMGSKWEDGKVPHEFLFPAMLIAIGKTMVEHCRKPVFLNEKHGFSSFSMMTLYGVIRHKCFSIKQFQRIFDGKLIPRDWEGEYICDDKITKERTENAFFKK